MNKKRAQADMNLILNRIMLIPLIMCVKVTIMTMGLMEMKKIQEKEIKNDRRNSGGMLRQKFNLNDI